MSDEQSTGTPDEKPKPHGRVLSLIEASLKSIVLSDRQLPWERGWTALEMQQNRHHNFITNHVYTGWNQFVLSLVALERGYSDPRWTTFAAIRKAGLKMVDAKGAGVHILRPNVRALLDSSGNPRLNARGEELKMITFSTAVVFNAAVIADMPPLPGIEELEGRPETSFPARLKEFMDSDVVNVQQVPMNMPAHYSPSSDVVRIHDSRQYTSDGAAISTLVHELSHWAATSEERAKVKDEDGLLAVRKYIQTNFKSRDESYAIEEAAVEMATYLMCSANALGYEPLHHDDDQLSNSEEYIRHWLTPYQSNEARYNGVISLVAQSAISLSEGLTRLIPKDK